MREKKGIWKRREVGKGQNRLEEKRERERNEELRGKMEEEGKGGRGEGK